MMIVNKFAGVNPMFKYISYLLVVVGAAFLVYGGYNLLQSHLDEGKRLDEAKAITSTKESENVVKEVEEPEEMSVNYEDFETGDTVGILYIPRLDREIPIVEGTDEDELAQGVGHYKDTGYPGENRQILLSGHRDTVFREFGDLEDGDEFHVIMPNGTFVYEMQDHKIVDADDRTVIDPNREEEFLTLSTCYPFSYVGSAPDRYVVYAYPK